MLKRVAFAGGVIALLLVLALAGVWLWGQVTSQAVAQTPADQPTYSPSEIITVVGQGSVHVKPDIAQVSIGVNTSAESISQAVADNEAKMTAILAALEKAGVAEKDIQTMNYSIQLDNSQGPVPATGSSAEPTKPTYTVSNMVNVTVRNLDSVGDVLDAAIEAGANNIWGISFAVSDPTAAQSDARVKAIDDAKARAQALADLNGVKLGPVMSVSETVSGGPVPLPAAYESAAAKGGTISPGELEISYQVQVSYFIQR
jgi:uncharacterized protein YggE